MLINLLNILLMFVQISTDFEVQLDDYLQDQLRNYTRFEYSIDKEPKGISKLSIDNSREFKLTGSKAYVPVTVHYKSGKETSTFLSLDLKLYNMVPVAIGDLRRGDILNMGQFNFEEQEVSHLRGGVVNYNTVFNNYRLKYNLRSGDVLTLNKIEQVPVIKFGDKIKASVASGKVIVSTDAIARQEGNVGDIINIKSIDGKQFKARIIDQFNVLIIE